MFNTVSTSFDVRSTDNTIWFNHDTQDYSAVLWTLSGQVYWRGKGFKDRAEAKEAISQAKI